MQKTTHFTCIKSSNTEGLNIDKTIFQHDRVFQFELGKKYSVYGEILGSKAIYESVIGEIDYDDKIIKLYENTINTNPTNWYISLFKTPALLHYECEHFNMNKEKYINTICRRIFRKQDKFINENNVE